LSSGQKDALLAWTGSGGDLIFVDGSVAGLFPAAPNAAAVSSQAYFFGRIYFPTSAEIGSRGIDGVLSASSASDLGLPATRSPDWTRIIERGFRLPIPGVSGVPARAYMLILVLFAVLIGPVNYVYLRRRYHPAMILVTAPLISAVFIAMLAVYAVFGEGFGMRGRAETLTILDQPARQAVTRASVSLYAAGMAPSGGLRFSRDAAVFPLGIVDGVPNTERESLDLTEQQRFAAGLIRARSPSNFEQIVFRPARERLTFSADGGRVSVVNGLGVRVNRLFYRAGDMVYRLEAGLEPGERAVLRAEAWKQSAMFSLVFPYTESRPVFPRKYQQIIDAQPDGSYLAVVDRSPFWEPGVADLEERGSTHLVLGTPGGEP
jgi:hypothetical protein